MQSKNILLFVATLTLLVNYNNYLLPNRDKIDNTITLLEHKIKKEQAILQRKIDPSQLHNKYQGVFFEASSYSYSQAMGELQNMINKSAKNECSVEQIQWAQVPQTTQWYQPLKINLSLKCSPEGVFHFINNLYKYKKLIYFDYFKMFKPRRDQKLIVATNIIAFRTTDAEK